MQVRLNKLPPERVFFFVFFFYRRRSSFSRLVAPKRNECSGYSLSKKRKKENKGGQLFTWKAFRLLAADVFPRKTHLDATVRRCNPPARFWRTNYCALVKQTI